MALTVQSEHERRDQCERKQGERDRPDIHWIELAVRIVAHGFLRRAFTLALFCIQTPPSRPSKLRLKRRRLQVLARSVGIKSNAAKSFTG